MTERAPRGPLAALDEANRTGNRTGGARQQVANAAPLPTKKSAVGEALAALYAASDISFWNDDIFDLTSAGAQYITLTYAPIEKSLHVQLNGVTTRKGVDWTLSGNTLSVLAPMDAQIDDVLLTEYAYYTGVPSMVADATGWTFASGQGIHEQPSLPTGAGAGDLAVLFIAADPSNTLTLNGWTLQASDTITYTYTYTHYALTKTLVGGDAMPSLAFANNNSNVFICAVHEGGGSYAADATTTTSSSATGPSPAAPGGTLAVRCWMSMGSGVIVAPGRGEEYTTPDVGGTDVDLLVTVETNLTAATATFSGTGSPWWIAHTIGVTT